MYGALFLYTQPSEIILELGRDKTSFACCTADDNIWDTNAALRRGVLGYGAMYSCRWLHTCRGNMLPTFSIMKTKAAI
jgi:hypothetical protein